MVTIVGRPERYPVENYLLLSRWSSSRQPYLFKLQRQDFIFVSLNHGITTMVMTVPASEIAKADPQVGDLIYFEDILKRYATTGTITSRADATTYSLLYLDTPNGAFPWTFNGYANFVKRENYFVEVSINGYVARTGQQKVFGTMRVSPDYRGEIRVDVRAFLNGFVEKTNLSGYFNSQRNWKDNGCWGWFTLSFEEKWTIAVGSIEGTLVGNVTEFADTVKYYFIDGVKQLLSEYGQNFLDRVAMLETGTPAARTSPAKFLTEGSRVRYWPGFPFDVSIIMDESLNSADMTYEEEAFGETMISLGTRDEALVKTHQGGVVRINPKPGLPAGTAFMDLWLEVGGLPSVGYYEEGTVEDGYFTETTAVTGYNYQATEKLRIKVENDACGDVYLTWKNRLGGWNYWLFEKRYERSMMSKTNGVYSVEPDNIEYSTSRQMITSASSTERYKVGCMIEQSDVGVLKSLEVSPNVLMLVNNVGGQYKWLSVSMLNKGFKFVSVENEFDVEFEFDLPEQYTVPNTI